MIKFIITSVAVTVLWFYQFTLEELTGQEAVKTKANQSTQKISPANFLKLSDAEIILGESAQLSDSSTTSTDDALRYLCSYTATSKDTKTDKTGVIYFLFEDYKQLSAAQKKYSYIKTANQNHGIKTLNDLGDEAYFHTDSTNFYFIMVRKGNQVFNMKVNKITSKTKLDEFMMVAKQIAVAL